MLRPLVPFEYSFLRPGYLENIVVSLKFSESKFVDRAVENYRRLMYGLRIHVEDQKYYRNSNKSGDINIVKIPNWIQDCRIAGDWLFKNHTKDMSDSLAVIGYNSRIVSVNSNHNLSDGVFMINAINHILDDPSTVPFCDGAPVPAENEFVDDFKDGEKYFDRSLILPTQKKTMAKIDESDPMLGGADAPIIEYNIEIPSEKLSCYDHKTKSLKGFSDLTFTAMSMAMTALKHTNNESTFEKLCKPIEYLSSNAVIDLRRFGRHTKDMTTKNFDWRLGQCVSVTSLGIEADTEKDSVRELSKKFRQYLNKISPHGLFYGYHHFDEIVPPTPGHVNGVSSCIGAIKIKHPIIDFDFADKVKIDPKYGSSKGCGGSQFAMVSYSKITETKNNVHLYFHYRPEDLSYANFKILQQSIAHFITHVPIDYNYRKALHEICEFQKELKQTL